MKTVFRVIASSIFMVVSTAIVSPSTSKVLAQDTQTSTFPLVRPPVWTGSYAGFPTAEEACQHIATNDRGGRRVLKVNLLPPADSYWGPIFYSAICELENWGGEPTSVSCPYEHPPYDPYIYIGDTKGICVLTSVYENSKLASYARNATGELIEDAKNYAGTIPTRVEEYIDNFMQSLKDRGFDAVDKVPLPAPIDIRDPLSPPIPSGLLANITVPVVRRTAIEWTIQVWDHVLRNLQDATNSIDLNKELTKNKKFSNIRRTNLPVKNLKTNKS